MKPDVRVCADVNELSRRAAEAAVRTINNAARGAGRCSLVLSGGNTPRTLYGLLASEFRDQIPWARVHVFWGDERYVSPHDPDSNYRMARETSKPGVSNTILSVARPIRPSPLMRPWS
jgi:6-phosphogluconolactonase